MEKDKNLLCIPKLKKILRADIGFSGHGQGFAGSIGAIALGANVIEKHCTLNKKMAGPDHSASLEFKDLKKLIELSKKVKESLGSTKKNLLTTIKQSLKEMDFAVTDLSHSRAIIELDGENSIEVLKKGCPFNFNELKKNNCVNSVFHGITITVDMIDDDPNKIRLFALRSFGESLYHSITDASLEFGYKAI